MPRQACNHGYHVCLVPRFHYYTQHTHTLSWAHIFATCMVGHVWSKVLPYWSVLNHCQSLSVLVIHMLPKALLMYSQLWFQKLYSSIFYLCEVTLNICHFTTEHGQLLVVVLSYSHHNAVYDRSTSNCTCCNTAVPQCSNIVVHQCSVCTG